MKLAGKTQNPSASRGVPKWPALTRAELLGVAAAQHSQSEVTA
jgi:hypothetical protein